MFLKSQHTSEQMCIGAFRSFHTVLNPIPRVLFSSDRNSDYMLIPMFLFPSCRLIASSILMATFGHEVTSEQDPYINLVNRTTKMSTDAGSPGGTIIDLFPARKSHSPIFLLSLATPPPPLPLFTHAIFFDTSAPSMRQIVSPIPLHNTVSRVALFLSCYGILLFHLISDADCVFPSRFPGLGILSTFLPYVV